MSSNTPTKFWKHSVRSNMKSYVFFTFGLALLALAFGCNDAAKPPTIVKSSPTPSSATSQGHDHAEDKNAPRISLNDAKKEYDDGTAVIVDVREPGAYRFERIKGSINVPEASLATSLDKIPKGKKLIAYCS